MAELEAQDVVAEFSIDDFLDIFFRREGGCMVAVSGEASAGEDAAQVEVFAKAAARLVERSADALET